MRKSHNVLKMYVLGNTGKNAKKNKQFELFAIEDLCFNFWGNSHFYCKKVGYNKKTSRCL